MARARGARAQLALAFESTYGTPPASGFFQMPFATSSLGQTQPLLESELLGYGRDPLAPELDVVNVDGDITVPLDATSIGYWLKGACGDPTTTGADPYTHVFDSGSWTLPSLAIEHGLPDVPHYAMAAGCMVDRLTIPMQRSGNQQATVGLVAQGETVASSAQSGSLTALTLDRLPARLGAITRGGSTLGNVVSAEIVYQNNLDRVETIRSDGKIDGLDPAMAMLSGQIVVRFADQTLLNQAINGTAAAFEFSWVKSASASLTLDVPKLYLPRPKIEVPGPGGIQATFAFQAAQDDAQGPMCTFTLISGQSDY